MTEPDTCPCGHPMGGNYLCVAGLIYGPCPDPNCGGTCEATADCTSPDCACNTEEDQP
ncbi:hypothetical protein ACGF0D_10595 [Kitasatospora sp. NPDC048298]|uniref:hypothetical protein n=1 Tax=Kitasatospora sp. NPDC048298 TaxID=3364049 RepID=UPI003723470B